MENMKLIGAKFLEIEAKRDPEFSGKIELKTNIQINSIEVVKESKETIKLLYTFEINYGKLGLIKMKGNLFLLSNAKTIKTIQKQKENKQYNTPEYIQLTNFIIKKASIKAFELEEELNLPIHIKLPTLSIKKD